MNYRPVILIGQGIRSNPALINFLCSQQMPVLTTWMAADLIPENHPAFCGRPGIFGQRAANIILQKADEIRCFGARLDGEQVAYDYERFAPNAKRKYFADADIAECARMKTYGWDVSVVDISKKLQPPYEDPYNLDGSWLAWCKALYTRFRSELPILTDVPSEYVDPFMFINYLSEFSTPNDVFAIGSSGNAPTVFYQAFKVQAGQRISNVSTIGAMGADIPMALGACLATGRRTICVTGDGGFQLNTQELETIRRLRLQIIFFVMNNNGYNSIRTAQMARFGRVMGADPQSGLTLPLIEDIATGYRIPYMKLWGRDLPDFQRCFDYAPIIIEIMVDPEWQQFPRVMASMVDGQLQTDDMQDMTPKIDDLQALMEY